MNMSILLKLLKKLGLGIVILLAVIVYLVADTAVDKLFPSLDTIFLMLFMIYIVYKCFFSSLSLSTRIIFVSNIYVLIKKKQVAVKFLEDKIRNEDLSELESIRIRLKIIDIYYKNGDYGNASHNLDYAQELIFRQRKKFIISVPLVLYMRIYIKNNEKEKAISLYQRLIDNKICPREERIEKILYTDVDV